MEEGKGLEGDMEGRKRTFKEADIQTESTGETEGDDNPIDEEHPTVNDIPNATEQSHLQQNNISFADEIKLEVRNTIQGALKEAEKRVEHFTHELDKHIEFMYTEQKNIKEAHELGLAQAKAGCRLTERKNNLINNQLQATLGIIADTEKRMECMGRYIDGLEKKKKEHEKKEKEKKEKEREEGNERRAEAVTTKKKTKGGREEKEEGEISCYSQGPKNTHIEGKEEDRGSDADNKDSEEEVRHAESERHEGNKPKTKGKEKERILVPATQEWGGWGDIC